MPWAPQAAPLLHEHRASPHVSQVAIQVIIKMAAAAGVSRVWCGTEGAHLCPYRKHTTVIRNICHDIRLHAPPWSARDAYVCRVQASSPRLPCRPSSAPAREDWRCFFCRPAEPPAPHAMIAIKHSTTTLWLTNSIVSAHTSVRLGSNPAPSSGTFCLPTPCAGHGADRRFHPIRISQPGRDRRGLRD